VLAVHCKVNQRSAQSVITTLYTEPALCTKC